MTKRAALHSKNLQTLFYPKSVAIVGTNKVKGTVPGDIFINILHAELNGATFPVNPREKYIGGVKAYKYVVDIPDEIDLAIIVFPSSVCNKALEQCGQKGVKAVIIISAGFKEIGGKGLEREKELLEIAGKYDMSFIGPNCLGVINTDPLSRLNASFARKFPAEGNIAFLSQSGALCTAVLDYALAKNIGFSKFVSFGNKADISEIDLLYYLIDDDKTKVILLYLEEITDGPGLMQAARDVIEKSHKPVLILKSGRTSAGASAAASHTGSLAGSDEICDAAFKQAGIIRCDNIEEMFNIAIALAYQPLPKTNNVAIITNAGGPGVLTTDAAIKQGLQLAQFSEETTNTLKRSLPTTANIKNPVDVIGDARADRYYAAMSAALKEKSVDGVFVILTPQSMTDINKIAEEVTKIAHEYDKPVYASFMGEADVASGIKILQKHQIPHYILPESMCKPFYTAYMFNRKIKSKLAEPVIFTDVDKEKAQALLAKAADEGRSYLPEYLAAKVIEAYKLPVVANGFATSAEEAGSIAESIGFPVVMKVMSDDIIHKYDVGGVILDVNSKEEAEKQYANIFQNVNKKMPEAKIDGVFIARQISAGTEVILGVKRDPSFGAVVMFGLGGIFVEVFKDVSFRVAPVSKEAALSMVKEVKSSKLLLGARGRAVLDIESIANSIMRLSQLALDCPQIKELDINPMIILEEGEGCYVADTKIII
ncbi:Acetyl-CoA synthetase (ADP-forming) alpha and beta chains, putative [hydrothermal vent metagenome]|uniref:Acetyl-CoA synthetase (ADP-forming) alpha and beta chains, putative n=1 Tax=hydrothermal vent metagenome TaxID=652676 RepID=A0A3B0U6H0_9ZZZZ